MIYAVFHPRRGAYIEHAVSARTGKAAPRFTWEKARKPENEGGPKRFESPGAARRWLEEKLKTQNHRMERCFVAELK